MNLGGAIQTCRLRRGLSQAKVAELAGCSVSYLSMLENGKKKDPGLVMITSIANALNVPLEIMFFLAADKGEVEGLDQALAGQLAVAALNLLNERHDRAA